MTYANFCFIGQIVHKKDTITPQLIIRFSDGNKMWIATDSSTDVLLHPVFLKYIAMCILLGAALDSGGGSLGFLSGQQIATLWFILGIETMLWLALALSFVFFLARRSLIRSVYTPIILLPNLIVIEWLSIKVAGILGHSPELSIDLITSQVLHGVVVLLVFDLLFSNFVVFQHPAFSASAADSRPGSTPIPQTSADAAKAPEVEPTVAEPEAQAGIEPRLVETDTRHVATDVSIGGKNFRSDEIVALKSEDHYLTVVTATRKVLVRARLTETVKNLDFRIGVQISRSIWVAFAFIDRLAESDDGLKVIFRDGSEETVAMVRRHAVRSAYEIFLAERSSGKA